jgi:hypothetical protein
MEQSTLPTLNGLVAPLLFCDTTDAGKIDYCSMWIPRMWKKCTPFVFDQQYIPPCNMGNINIEMTFEVPKLAHGIMRADLRIVSPPYTIAPAGATAYFQDWLGYALIDYLQIIYGSNRVYTREKYDLMIKTRQALDFEQYLAKRLVINGDLTQAQRQANLVNGTEVFLNFMLPFEMMDSAMLPLITLSNKMRVNFKTEPLQNFITTPNSGAGGAAPTTYSTTGAWNFELILEVIRVTGDESGFMLALSQEEDGIAYMVHQSVRQMFDQVSSVSNGYKPSLKLTAMTKPLQCLSWVLIPYNLTNHTGTDDLFMFAPQPTPVPIGMNPYTPLLGWGIQSAGLIIQRTPFYNNYDRIVQYSMFMPGLVGDYIYFQAYTRYPCSANVSSGYADYTVFTIPNLEITFQTGGTGVDFYNNANPQVLNFYVIADDYNFWFFKLGNWTLSFN